MNELKHYGVLGMRWGKRRAGGNHSVSVGTGVRGALKEVGGLVKDAHTDNVVRTKALLNKFKPTPPHADSTKVAQLRKKPISKLSNEELKTAITRMQLEKQFKELNPKTVNRGKGILAKMLLDLGAKSLNSYAATQNSPEFVSMFERMRKKAQGMA